MRRILPVFLLAALLLRCTVFCQNDTSKIGGLVSLSGNWGAIGRGLQDGMTLGAEEINASGGVLGKKIGFDFQDTDEEKSGAKVVSAFKLLRGRGTTVFFGPTGVPSRRVGLRPRDRASRGL